MVMGWMALAIGVPVGLIMGITGVLINISRQTNEEQPTIGPGGTRHAELVGS